jgi:hypothetical protein
MDPLTPTREVKTAWESAKEKAGVESRFHDLRHTACTRLLERGVPLPVVASLLGWSAGTTAKMAKRYGHIGSDAHRAAVAALDGSLALAAGSQGKIGGEERAESESGSWHWAQKGAQRSLARMASHSKLLI